MGLIPMNGIDFIGDAPSLGYVNDAILVPQMDID